MDIFNMEITTRTLSCILEDDGSHTVSADLMAQLEPQGGVITNNTFSMSRVSIDEVAVPLTGGGDGYLTFFRIAEFEADVNNFEFTF